MFLKKKGYDIVWHDMIYYGWRTFSGIVQGLLRGWEGLVRRSWVDVGLGWAGLVLGFVLLRLPYIVGCSEERDGKGWDSLGKWKWRGEEQGGESKRR